MLYISTCCTTLHFLICRFTFYRKTFIHSSTFEYIQCIVHREHFCKYSEKSLDLSTCFFQILSRVLKDCSTTKGKNCISTVWGVREQEEATPMGHLGLSQLQLGSCICIVVRPIHIIVAFLAPPSFDFGVRRRPSRCVSFV